MATATRDDVVALLGDVDDLLIERIVATGASTAEIAEALEDLQDESQFGEQRRVESSPRAAAVRPILEELFDEGDEGDALPVAADSP